MQVLRILASVALALGLVSASQPLEARRLATCGTARVRKPWENLSTQEQSLYIEALGLAIQSGVVKDLSAMHLESMGETQAHHSCAFFAWHRRMLLAFESYMRDLDPKFACLTIPYYDVHTAYANAANKKCKNMFECSPIFRGLGGAVEAYSKEQLVFNGEAAGGYAVKGAPFIKDCDDDNKMCGTMLRNNLEKKSVPSGAGFGSFLAIVTRSKDYATFLEGIQFGLHNEVHNAIGGAMSTFASPRDVVFYSWHGAIDMYLATYHQCHLGAGNADPNSREAFTTATQTCGGVSGVGADSKIVMRFKVDGQLVDATQHPLLGKYFAKLGDTMGQFGDTTTLGEFSYTYEFPSIIQTQVLSNKDICKGADAARSSADKPTTPAPTTPAPTTANPIIAVNGSDGSMGGLNITVVLPSVGGSHDGVNATIVLPGTQPTVVGHTGIVVVKESAAGSATTKPPASSKPPSYGYGFKDTGDDSDDKSNGDAKRSADNISSGLVGGANGALKPTEATSGSYWEWVAKTYDGLVKLFDGDMAVVTEQMRVIECMAFDKVFGVVEFSDDFVKNFHLASSKPVCGNKIEAVTSGAVTVAVATPAAAFKPEEVTFAAPAVIEVVKKQAAVAAAAPAVEKPQMIDAAFIKTAEKTLQDAAVSAKNDNKNPTEVRSASDEAGGMKPPMAKDVGKKSKKDKKHRDCAN